MFFHHSFPCFFIIRFQFFYSILSRPSLYSWPHSEHRILQIVDYPFYCGSGQAANLPFHLFSPLLSSFSFIGTQPCPAGARLHFLIYEQSKPGQCAIEFISGHQGDAIRWRAPRESDAHRRCCTGVPIRHVLSFASSTCRIVECSPRCSIHRRYSHSLTLG